MYFSKILLYFLFLLFCLTNRRLFCQQTSQFKPIDGPINSFLISPTVPQSCFGATTKQDGVCVLESFCNSQGGIIDGRCAINLGVCCLQLVKCNGVLKNNSFFTNNEFPLPARNGGLCNVKVDIPPNVQQIKLELYKFQLSPPINGECKDDGFWINGANSEFKLPRLCGFNSYQHLYIPVDQRIGSQLNLFIGLSANNAKRFWFIKAVLLEKGNPSIAPLGCLQYFQAENGLLSSFNFDQDQNKAEGNIGALAYALCIKPLANKCSVQISSLFFNMLNFQREKRQITSVKATNETTKPSFITGIVENSLQFFNRLRNVTFFNTSQSTITANDLVANALSNNIDPKFLILPSLIPISLPPEHRNCQAKDRLSFPPTTEQQGSIVMCGSNFENGNTIVINKPPFIINVETDINSQGHGFYFRYDQRPC